MTNDAMRQMPFESAFHSRTSKLTNHFTEYRGFRLPTRFADQDVVQEYTACRERAAVLDLSALRKFEVLGPDAEELLQRTLTRDVRRMAAGEVSYSAMCNEAGGVIDDGTLFRLGADNFRWICNDDRCGDWLREQAKTAGLNVWFKSSTDQLHNLAIQGPKSRDILKQIIWTAPTQPNLDELAWFRFAIGRIDDYNGIPVVLSRTGYTGELGYELWCHPRDGAAVWDAVWQAGTPHGMLPIGLEVLDTLRIEAGLVFAGQEFGPETDPFEAGIGFTVALNKDAEFIGKEALIQRQANQTRKLVGLELEGEEPVSHGDPVRIGQTQAGVVTSATRSPLLGKSIALCNIESAADELGTAVEVGKPGAHQELSPATVVALPFYDPEKVRVRS